MTRYKNFHKKIHTNFNKKFIRKIPKWNEGKFFPTAIVRMEFVRYEKVIPAKINVFSWSSGSIILAQERTPKSQGPYFLRILNLFFIGEKITTLVYWNSLCFITNYKQNFSYVFVDLMIFYKMTQFLSRLDLYEWF